MTSSDPAARLLDRLTGVVRRGVEPTSRVEVEHGALLRVAAAVSGANDLDQVIDLAAEEALRAIGAAELAIYRFEDGATRCRILINVGELQDWEKRRPRDEVYEVAEFPRLQELAETANPVFNSANDPDCDPAARTLLQSLGKSSDLGVAIVVEGEIWGGIWAATAIGSSFEVGDVRFLEAIGGQIATAIARVELFSRVSRLAYEDPLTGLANRRALEERLARALDRYAAGESAIALMLCDADRLKRINDVHGHAGGDTALRNVATALVAAAAAHPGAFVARIGGDEFCVLVEGLERAADGAELGTIESIAEQAQSELADLQPTVTLSCGAATATPRNASAAKLLGAADTAQYVAKRRGGNRIFTAAQIAEVPNPFTEPALSGFSSTERIANAIGEIIAAFNGELADAPALDRLERAGSALIEAGDLATCAISFAAHGDGTLRELSQGDRGENGSGLNIVRSWEEPDLYRLDDFPETARVIAAGSGSFVVAVGDEGADSAERDQLELDGFANLVAAAAGDDEGVYLVELLGAEPGADLCALEPALALAVAAAIPPRAHRRNSRSASAGRRALELTIALADRLAGATAEREVTAAAVDELQRGFDCTAVHVVAKVDEMLELRAEHGKNQTPPDWSQDADAGLIGRCLRERTPVLAVDVTREPQYRALPVNREVRSELVVPIFDGYEVWGVINLEDERVGLFGPGDARLVESVAAQVGGALTSIRLYEQLDRAYVGTADALMAALEAKDSYTAEHSQSIVVNSVAVGRLLGLNGDELRMLRYAAAFHDIGKLGIPLRMLNKPGPLNADEWDEMRRHTLIGERILAPIEFLAPIRPLIRSAHEQWDGGGYPDGLAGEEIPLGARIIFACDAYGAMTTDRPYREARSIEEARRELRRESGRQFDPLVAEALLVALEGDGGAAAAGDPDSAA